MLLKEFRNHFNKELSAFFPQTEIDSFFFLLIEKELDLQRIDLVLNTQLPLSEEKFKHLYNSLSRLKAQEPIQYILGETEFYGLPFKVTKDTLIPRPETEELVAWVISEVTKLQPCNVADFSILEIGTGSGCIPISLAKNLPKAAISSIDISKNALAIAKENALLNAVNIHFIAQDILSIDKLPQQYDIIVSNPPYVRELEKKEIKPNVLENEPHLALFVADNNPLIFYSKIADLAKKHLSEKGVLYFEINQYLGKETVEMLSEKGFITELKKDLFGNDRMTKSMLKS
jgi:release factor glutamine methyltransferase